MRGFGVNALMIFCVVTCFSKKVTGRLIRKFAVKPTPKQPKIMNSCPEIPETVKGKTPGKRNVGDKRMARNMLSIDVKR